jgi:hypothetical protein
MLMSSRTIGRRAGRPGGGSRDDKDCMTRVKSETSRNDNVNLKHALGQIWADAGNLSLAL